MDCPDVRQGFHWGVLDDAETYVQESGRAGREKQPSCALLVYGRKDLRQTYISDHMRRYCQNQDECRKKILFEDFEGCENIKFNGCMCCDVCKKQCMCSLWEMRPNSECLLFLYWHVITALVMCTCNKYIQWNLIITVTLGPNLADCYIEVAFLLNGIQNHHNQHSICTIDA